MTTSTTTTIPSTPSSTHRSRSNSTRSRKHSGPVQIHALLRASTENVDVIKCGHYGHHRHRRGASFSASATVSPTPVDRPAAAKPHSPLASALEKKSSDGVKSLSTTGNYTPTVIGTAAPPPSSPPLASQTQAEVRTRQRSHSYASAPLSTLVTHLDSPSLASFTPADVHPCAAGSLRRCQWMLNMNAYGTWYGGESEFEEDEPANPISHPFNRTPENDLGHTITTPSPPPPPPPSLPQEKKPKLALPFRLWKKFASPSQGKGNAVGTKRSDSESGSNAGVGDSDTDRESDSDGDEHTPSLSSPRSSRQSSRSRSSNSRSASVSLSSPSNLLPIPSITRRHSGLGEHTFEDSTTSSSEFGIWAGTASGAVHTTPSAVAVQCEGGDNSEMALSTRSGSSVASRTKSPEASLIGYKYAPTATKTGKKPQLSVKTSTSDMPAELISTTTTTSTLSPPKRTLRSSKKRPFIDYQAAASSALPDVADLRIPFPVPSTTDTTLPQNTFYTNPSSHPTSLRTSSSQDTKTLLTLSDLERASKLMRSTTTCAVCGKSGSDFPRCPRTGVAWCSRACRIAAKNNASLVTN